MQVFLCSLRWVLTSYISIKELQAYHLYGYLYIIYCFMAVFMVISGREKYAKDFPKSMEKI